MVAHVADGAGDHHEISCLLRVGEALRETGALFYFQIMRAAKSTLAARVASHATLRNRSIERSLPVRRSRRWRGRQFGPSGVWFCMVLSLWPHQEKGPQADPSGGGRVHRCAASGPVVARRGIVSAPPSRVRRDPNGKTQARFEKLQEKRNYFRGMSKPGGARVKPSNRKPGETVQETSVQSPVERADCQ